MTRVNTPTRKTGPLSFLSTVLQRPDDINYRDIAEQLSDAMFLATPRTGLFRYFNRRALELTGYSRDELERHSLSELLSAREAAVALDLIHTLEIGASHVIQQVPLKTRNGKPVFADMRVSATVNDGEVLVLILARDSNERAFVERASRSHEQSLLGLNELASKIILPPPESLAQTLKTCQRAMLADTMALYSYAGPQVGFQLSESADAPPEFPALLGLADPLAANRTFDWRTGERPTSAITRAARALGFSIIHARALTPPGRPPEILVAGYRHSQIRATDITTLSEIAVKFLVAFQRLAEQHRQHITRQAEADELSARFGILLNETAEGMVRVGSEGRIVELNLAAENLLGFGLADTANSPLEDVLVSAQPLAQPMLAALNQGQRWSGVEADLIRRDGSSVAVHVRAIPLTAEPNLGGLILISDRTDQRQFQAQSNQLENRAWLGDLSAIFAHDVRNPLNGIATGLAYLAGKFDPSDPLAEDVSKMQAEVQRVDQLLKNVLLVAKSTHIEYKPTPLHHLLERTLARWGGRLARRNIQLDQQIDPRTPLAMADAHQMDQVFTNLIVNAYEAMNQTGGTLSIHCHAATHPEAPRGDFVEMRFVDTGPGIPSEMKPRIFDPFITTKSDGTGLGLAITKRIVTAHKGAIFVESFPGTGTIFSVFIPVAPENDERGTTNAE